MAEPLRGWCRDWPVRTGRELFCLYVPSISHLATVAEMPCIVEIPPGSAYGGHMLRNVAVIVLDDVAPFELGVLCEVFGTDRTADGFPAYNFMVCSVDG